MGEATKEKKGKKLPKNWSFCTCNWPTRSGSGSIEETNTRDPPSKKQSFLRSSSSSRARVVGVVVLVVVTTTLLCAFASSSNHSFLSSVHLLLLVYSPWAAAAGGNLFVSTSINKKFWVVFFSAACRINTRLQTNLVSLGCCSGIMREKQVFQLQSNHIYLQGWRKWVLSRLLQ